MQYKLLRQTMITRDRKLEFWRRSETPTELIVWGKLRYGLSEDEFTVLSTAGLLGESIYDFMRIPRAERKQYLQAAANTLQSHGYTLETRCLYKNEWTTPDEQWILNRSILSDGDPGDWYAYPAWADKRLPTHQFKTREGVIRFLEENEYFGVS